MELVERHTSNEQRIFLQKPLWKQKLEASAARQENNIKVGIMEVSFKDVKWIDLSKDRVQGDAFLLAVINLLVILPQS